MTKILPSDSWFSKCIRERANWKCERCGSICPPDKKMGFHCAHFMGRGNWSTRFDPDNAAGLCYGCHRYVDGHPSYKTVFFEGILGRGLAEIIQFKAKQPAKGIKKHLKAITRHYRAEYLRLVELRHNGDTSRLVIQNYEL